MSQKKKNGVRKRSKYRDPSLDFSNWVNQLGWEETWLGRLIYKFNKRFGVKKICIIFLFCTSLSAAMFYELNIIYQPNLGEVARVDIKSPIAFEMVDEVITLEKQLESEKNVPPVFDEDKNIYEDIYQRVYVTFKNIRKDYRKSILSKPRSRRAEEIKNFLVRKSSFEKQLNIKISINDFEWLVEKGFSVYVQNLIRTALRSWSLNKIYDGSKGFLRFNSRIAVIRDKYYVDDKYTVSSDSFMDIRIKNAFSLPEFKKRFRFKITDEPHLLRISQSFLVPNVFFNKEETEKRKVKARDLVLPVKIVLNKNQTIVSANSVVQSSHLRIINEIRERASGSRVGIKIFTIASVLFLMTLVSFSYLRRFTINKIRHITIKDLLIMGTVAFISVCLIKLFIFFVNAAVLSKMGDSIPPEAVVYASPLAAAAMLMGLLIPLGELVWIFILFISVVFTIMLDMNFAVFIISSLSGIAGARGVYKCEKRNDVYKAGIRVGLVSAASVFIMVLFSSFGQNPDWLNEVVWNVSAAFIGGLLSAMVTLALIPVLESLFNCTTDLKLLELSNLNHELIKDMMMKAPGTYHHSLAVGNMVEEAANRIEANALLAKVMAYYHDIGKTEHAQYFIENQHPSYNPHDNITPYMSKTIIISHVKDGAELGIKHKLGKPIIDGILQHHGTTLIQYFYNKALALKEDREEVEENEFRYPGPKPQFKEAALVMLADSIEAASRAIEEPTAAKLTSLVEKIIRDKFTDRQLVNCNLNFQEISIIRDSFTKALLSIYHHRISYSISTNENKKKE